MSANIYFNARVSAELLSVDNYAHLKPLLTILTFSLIWQDGDDGDFLYLTDNDADNSIDGGDDIEVIPFTLSGWGQGKTSQEVRPGEQVSEGVPPPPSFDETGKVIINKPSSLMTQRLISNRRIQWEKCYKCFLYSWYENYIKM